MNQQFENGIDKKSVPGCLGRMVDLFDLSTGNKLLTDQLHGDGSPLSRNQSDGGRISRFSDLIEHKVMSSDPTHSSLLKGTPMKMLIAHEMSKEIHESPQSSPGLVFKLMGVDTGPQELLDRGSQRGRQRGHSRSLSGSSLATTAWQQEQKESKEIYEIWKQPQKGSSERDKTMVTMSQPGETEKKMALVRQKFMEAKQLATDEKLRQSKQFEDALDVLSSNKDLFIRFLQEPNSLLAQHLRDLHLQSLPPSTTEPRRITVLRPSKMVDSNNIALLTKKSENSTKMSAFTSEVLGCKTDDNQPTRIILLRPSSGQIGEQNPPKSELGQQMDENLSGVSRVETSLSSAVSNGYIADESSFSKSDNEYQNGKLSDSEIVSPTSRHSWDFINKFDSLHSCSSFSRASYPPGSLVCKEAKKRLSERWAMTSTVTSDVQKLVQRNSSCTLGEILSISDTKDPAESHEEGFSKELEPRASTLSNAREVNENGNVVNSQRNLFKSKSMPVSSTFFGGRLQDSEVSKSGVGEKDGFKDDMETKILTRKLSFKEKVSSLFFSINKKTDKENPRSVQSPGIIGGENSSQHDHQAIKKQENLSNDLQGSDSISLGLNCDASSSEKPAQPRSTSCNQEQPSPISVLEAPFVDHETANLDSSEGKGAKQAVLPNKCRLVDKSPPIGSVSRVLSWESSCGETRASRELENMFLCNSEEEEEAEWFFLVQTLLSLAGLDNVEQLSSVFARCDSSESPLDLSLRDKYVDLNDKELLMHETNWRKRSTRKLVFDCVNAALVEISCMTQIDSSESLVDLVWAWIKKWRSSEVVGCASAEEDDDILVDLMVRKEVAGNGFVECFVPLEIELLVKEMEADLVEEIVREAVVELRGT